LNNSVGYLNVLLLFNAQSVYSITTSEALMKHCLVCLNFEYLVYFLILHLISFLCCHRFTVIIIYTRLSYIDVHS